GRDRARPVPARDRARDGRRPRSCARDLRQRDPACGGPRARSRGAGAQHPGHGRRAGARGPEMSIHIAQAGGPPQEVALSSALPKTLPVLPLKDSVPFPDTLTPLAVGQERSVRLVNEVLSGDRMLVMVASKNPEVETPGPDDLYGVGVAGVVARML